MRNFTFLLLAVGAVVAMTDAPAFAQYGMPGGGMPQGRPERKLHKNRSPVLSPALNLVPGFSTSFEGQFLMRTLPQEQINRNIAKVGRQIEGLQNEAAQQEVQIRKGVGKTGHASRFMNTGTYFPSPAPRRR